MRNARELDKESSGEPFGVLPPEDHPTRVEVPRILFLRSECLAFLAALSDSPYVIVRGICLLPCRISCGFSEINNWGILWVEDSCFLQRYVDNFPIWTWLCTDSTAGIPVRCDRNCRLQYKCTCWMSLLKFDVRGILDFSELGVIRLLWNFQDRQAGVAQSIVLPTTNYAYC